VKIYKDEAYIWFELFRNTEYSEVIDECEYSSDEEDEDN
jgi:hypothetical protein